MLPKVNRISKNSEFQTVYKKGSYFGTKHLNFYVLKTKNPYFRVGFVVSIKISKLATRRNLLKRRLREIIRLNLDKLFGGIDLVISARPGSPTLSYKELEKTALWALNKLKLLKNS